MYEHWNSNADDTYGFLERRMEMYNHENLGDNEDTRKKEVCQNWGTIK